MARSGSRRFTPDRERARARIIESATALFAQRGVDVVTYGEIARRARLSRPLVYFYFPQRSDLLRAASARALEALRGRFVSAASLAGTGLESVEALGRAYLDFFHEDPEAARVMMMDRAETRSGEATVSNEPKVEVFRLLTTAVERGLADGTIAATGVDPRVVALNLWAFTHGLVELSAAEGFAMEIGRQVSPEAFLSGGMALMRRALASP